MDQALTELKAKNRFPNHVAIIMDGNGRWAKGKGLSRSQGHQHGLLALRKAVHFADQVGIKALTLFSFSSENWQRPEDEVNHILGLLYQYVDQDLPKLVEKNIKVQIIGRRDDLEENLQKILTYSEEETKHNTGMLLFIAFNYGGRDEIARAASLAAKNNILKLENGDALSVSCIEQYLDTAKAPDLDLIIRTSGEFRLSNFLLWQAAYAEFVFLPCFWPDFDEKAFLQALNDYGSRDRRFGDIDAITS